LAIYHHGWYQDEDIPAVEEEAWSPHILENPKLFAEIESWKLTLD
jgi:hypothetical protein